MPAVSKSQNRLMRAAAAKPAMARKLGVPVKVAKKFVSETHGMKVRDLPEKVGKK